MSCQIGGYSLEEYRAQLRLRTSCALRARLLGMSMGSRRTSRTVRVAVYYIPACFLEILSEHSSPTRLQPLSPHRPRLRDTHQPILHPAGARAPARLADDLAPRARVQCVARPSDLAYAAQTWRAGARGGCGACCARRVRYRRGAEGASNWRGRRTVWSARDDRFACCEVLFAEAGPCGDCGKWGSGL